MPEPSGSPVAREAVSAPQGEHKYAEAHQQDPSGDDEDTQGSGVGALIVRADGSSVARLRGRFNRLVPIGLRRRAGIRTARRGTGRGGDRRRGGRTSGRCRSRRRSPRGLRGRSGPRGGDSRSRIHGRLCRSHWLCRCWRWRLLCRRRCRRRLGCRRRRTGRARLCGQAQQTGLSGPRTACERDEGQRCGSESEQERGRQEMSSSHGPPLLPRAGLPRTECLSWVSSYRPFGTTKSLTAGFPVAVRSEACAPCPCPRCSPCRE
jgi:hypothetical protein